MPEKHNIRVAEEHVEALCAHDYTSMRTHHGEGCRFQASGIFGPDDGAAYQTYMQQNWTAFPDLTVQTAQMLAEGDYMAQNWIATGRHCSP